MGDVSPALCLLGHWQPAEWIPTPTKAPGLQDGVHCPKVGYSALRRGYRPPGEGNYMAPEWSVGSVPKSLDPQLVPNYDSSRIQSRVLWFRH